VKIVICGKGGSGKSTVTTLLARALNDSGKTVLVVDADESNLCLHRLLGARLPQVLMDAMGGRQGVKAQLNPASGDQPAPALLKDALSLGDIPESCLADADGIKLLVVGKIRSFGEGCACMIGNISKTVLSRLRECDDEFVLIDAEAGLEHFGRRVNAACDLILCVVDPTYESGAIADNVRRMADTAGIPAVIVLNKVDDAIREAMADRLKAHHIIAALPKDDRLFVQSLHGQALSADIAEVEDIRRFITSFEKPVSLAIF